MIILTDDEEHLFSFNFISIPNFMRYFVTLSCLYCYVCGLYHDGTIRLCLGRDNIPLTYAVQDISNVTLYGCSNVMLPPKLIDCSENARVSFLDFFTFLSVFFFILLSKEHINEIYVSTSSSYTTLCMI